MKVIFNYATRQFEPMEPSMRERFALGGGVIQGEKVGSRENFATPASKTFSKIDSLKDLILQYNNNPLILIDKTGKAKGANVISQMKVLQDAGFSQGFQSMSKTGPTRDLVRKELKKLLSYQDKMEAYMNNIVLDDNAPAVKFTNIRSHLAKKFGVSYDSMLLKNFLSNSKTYQENKKIFSALSQPLSKNKLLRAPDGTFRSMGDVAEKVLNKLPSSMGLFSTDVPERFILESAKRNFLQNKNLGREAKITFITNPEVTPRTQWQFIHNDTGRLFSSEPYLDEIEFQGKKYKNNYLYVKNAAEKYPEFKGVYKMYNEDLPKYKAAKTADGKSLDQAIKMKNYEITKKENYKTRRGVDIDHKDILTDPFGEKPDSLRLVDARVNRQAGMLKNYYKGKELQQKLIDIGYINPDKNVDDFINRTNEELKVFKPESPKAKGLAKKGFKTVLKQVPLVGSAIGLYDVGKAVKAGITNPLDLYTAYEVSPEIAAKQKAMREDPTGKLVQEEISKLPDIGQELPDSDEVAGLLEESGSPYMQFLQGGGQLTPEEFNQLQSIPQSDRPLTGELDLPEMDQTMMAAQGGRVGFKDGSPDPVEEMATLKQAIAALGSPELKDQFLYDTSFAGKLEKNLFGEEGDRNLMQQFNTQFLDPRSYPYYAQKTSRGLANIPELTVRFPLAAAYLFGKGTLAFENFKRTGDLSKFNMEDLKTAMEILEPKFTNLALEGKLGDVLGLSPEAIQAVEEKRTGPQKTTADLLQFTGEAVGPATPYVFLAKLFPKLPKQLKDLVGTTSAVDKVNKEIERRASQDGVDQTRRDILIATGSGGAIALLKYLGLDNLFKAAPKAVKAAPEIITKGGTPKYFFDFVSLIKSKGDDISEKAATLERQKVYDYNGYQLTEDISTGKISIRKDTEGGATYSIGDGEYETVEGIVKKEEINYDPPETILDDKGKPREVPDAYDEATLRPDAEGDLDDIDQGLDSIEDILELLSKDGKSYTIKELEEMGIDTAALGNYKPKKAGGGIVKLAGEDSGPPPKSGPTPHGLPYVAKNVRPIKERK